MDGKVYKVGERIKKLRNQYNLTQEELAERLGVQKNTVYRYENDLLTPSVDVFVKLAIMFNSSVDYLLGLGKESFLYLEEFTPEQRKYILNNIQGLKDFFDYGESKNKS